MSIRDIFRAGRDRVVKNDPENSAWLNVLKKRCRQSKGHNWLCNNG